MCMISTLPAWPKCQGWVVVALPAQGQAHPQQLSPSSLACLAPCWELLGVCQPQLQPHPVSSAASTSCLQEDPTSTTFFHFLCCSLCFGVADYSRPVAMTDCYCCPSPYWPHTIVQQSTGLLRPLVNSWNYQEAGQLEWPDNSKTEEEWKERMKREGD